MTKFGVEFESMTNLETTEAQTGEGSAEAGAQGSSLAQRLQGEVEDISQVVDSEFQAMAADAQALVQNGQRTLEGTQWEGARQGRALDVGSQLTTSVNNLIADGEAQMAEFKSQLSANCQAFAESIRSGFESQMNIARDNYEAMATEARTVNEQAQTIDSGGF